MKKEYDMQIKVDVPPYVNLVKKPLTHMNKTSSHVQVASPL